MLATQCRSSLFLQPAWQCRPSAAVAAARRRTRVQRRYVAASADAVEVGDASTSGPVITHMPFTTSMKVTKLPTMEDTEWRSAPVIRVTDIGEGTRCITIDAECSREMVPMKNAYLKPGQQAQVRLPGQENCSKVLVSSPPFSSEANYGVTLKSRGDIPAGTTKVAMYFISVRCPLDLHVLEAEAPDLYNLSEGDELELGPFDPSGMNLKPVMVLNRFPTLLFFAYGKGIAAARAIINARESDDTSLNLSLRRDVRLYYAAPEPSCLRYKDEFELWRNKKVKVNTIVRNAGEGWDGEIGSFRELWDGDDVEYDPRSTAVVICSDREMEEELDELVKDADFLSENVVKWMV